MSLLNFNAAIGAISAHKEAYLSILMTCTAVVLIFDDLMHTKNSHHDDMMFISNQSENINSETNETIPISNQSQATDFQKNNMILISNESQVTDFKSEYSDTILTSNSSEPKVTHSETNDTALIISNQSQVTDSHSN